MRVEAYQENRRAEHERDMRLAWAVRAFKGARDPTALLRQLTADPSSVKPLTDEERAQHRDAFARIKAAAGKVLHLVPLRKTGTADG